MIKPTLNHMAKVLAHAESKGAASALDYFALTPKDLEAYSKQALTDSKLAEMVQLKRQALEVNPEDRVLELYLLTLNKAQEFLEQLEPNPKAMASLVGLLNALQTSMVNKPETTQANPTLIQNAPSKSFLNLIQERKALS